MATNSCPSGVGHAFNLISGERKVCKSLTLTFRNPGYISEDRGVSLSCSVGNEFGLTRIPVMVWCVGQCWDF